MTWQTQWFWNGQRCFNQHWIHLHFGSNTVQQISQVSLSSPCWDRCRLIHGTQDLSFGTYQLWNHEQGTDLLASMKILFPPRNSSLQTLYWTVSSPVLAEISECPLCSFSHLLKSKKENKGKQCLYGVQVHSISTYCGPSTLAWQRRRSDKVCAFQEYTF